MIAVMTGADVVAKKAVKTTSIKITDEAVKWGRIASGFTGESLVEYVSRVIAERGQVDAAELYSQLTGERQAAAPPRPAGPKKGGGK